ncbi:protein LplB [Thermoclostridium stercorarium subsp. stercorarium DSM 8532]|uniref:Protein LplB n=3 Tax=Thermoclostridium stercorarium TaxID=1510 RepID=L7VGZ2_THES1|nr:ABC transporter permease subunit [Thermoclostridium stercorarium]AGC67250.1 protein LplB [Thermoclostridium stercorarium subsp. stercorarium DSM 8532]AGI38321.1 ABC transporter periplasmic subunit-1 [Thermoclostridium stercorarium subsp. stercorarium DSM 8532]ANW97756.1 protein lplB [Thermoclostridium stercorarium subsp. thermolacticum DSM 2910]ANX00283.1 protein lplB [Thermoclostridium stercorarium subsp. leptospartum DSM 9219]UZQ85828.1 ABC transporter permease subunit [Thermoclostridium 
MNGTSLQVAGKKGSKPKKILTMIKKDIWLYILLIPGVLHYIIFKYLPMWGILIAFKDYNAYLGFFDSPWVGFKHFSEFFSNPDFKRLLSNTLIISFYNLIFGFPAPIIMALMLNEVRKEWYKRTIQTLVYIPHFISWVIIASLTYTIFNSQGVINKYMIQMGRESTIPFLTDSRYFRAMIVGQTIWKETGFGTIIYLAALSNVDPQLYEAAIIDGANRFRQLWHITLPAIRSTVVTLLILRLGHILDNGFDQIFLMSNSLNRKVSEVFDTYVYIIGITKGAFSYSTAVGLFKGVIGIILIYSANWLAKKVGESGIL